MPTKELGLVRDILASNEASGQEPFINAVAMTQPSRDSRKEGQSDRLPQLALSPLWLSVHSGLICREPWPSASNSPCPNPSSK